MARDQTWLTKLKSRISLKLITPPSSNPSLATTPKSTLVGVLAFEISGLLSKLLAIHHSLSDPSILRLQNDVVSGLDGVHKLVSSDETFLLSLASAEILLTLRQISTAAATLIHRCSDPSLRSFSDALHLFASTGGDLHRWCATGADLDALIRRADRLVSATSALYREIDELTLLENSLKKKSPTRDEKLLELQQKIVWQKQEVKYVREKSLWDRTFDSAVLLLIRLIFTILARTKLVFGLGSPNPTAIPRSLSTGSATVFPLIRPDNNNNNNQTTKTVTDIFDGMTEALTPAANTLGSAALALHYANLIIVLEKMIKSPHLVGMDAREDVYSMLPRSIRSSLRARLKGVGFWATDPVLAGEWRDALSRILSWLTPLAHNMIKWQSERSFEHHNNNLMSKSNSVFLLQTLYFANLEKTEAAITELLVGLNYIWRFEREMNAKAWFECSNFFCNDNKSQQL